MIALREHGSEVVKLEEHLVDVVATTSSRSLEHDLALRTLRVDLDHEPSRRRVSSAAEATTSVIARACNQLACSSPP